MVGIFMWENGIFVLATRFRHGHVGLLSPGLVGVRPHSSLPSGSFAGTRLPVDSRGSASPPWVQFLDHGSNTRGYALDSRVGEHGGALDLHAVTNPRAPRTRNRILRGFTEASLHRPDWLRRWPLAPELHPQPGSLPRSGDGDRKSSSPTRSPGSQRPSLGPFLLHATHDITT